MITAIFLLSTLATDANIREEQELKTWAHKERQVVDYEDQSTGPARLVSILAFDRGARRAIWEVAERSVVDANWRITQHFPSAAEPQSREELELVAWAREKFSNRSDSDLESGQLRLLRILAFHPPATQEIWHIVRETVIGHTVFVDSAQTRRSIQAAASRQANPPEPAPAQLATVLSPTGNAIAVFAASALGLLALAFGLHRRRTLRPASSAAAVFMVAAGLQAAEPMQFQRDVTLPQFRLPAYDGNTSAVLGSIFQASGASVDAAVCEQILANLNPEKDGVYVAPCIAYLEQFFDVTRPEEATPRDLARHLNSGRPVLIGFARDDYHHFSLVVGYRTGPTGDFHSWKLLDCHNNEEVSHEAFLAGWDREPHRRYAFVINPNPAKKNPATAFSRLAQPLPEKPPEPPAKPSPRAPSRTIPPTDGLWAKFWGRVSAAFEPGGGR